MNQLANGEAPAYLKRILAGGVSIALQKSQTAIRPLACGDPIRRLVGKCFCVVGKDDIAETFRGMNYGVGCRGGVEVVAHSLRDVLQKHREGSNLALLKIDFKNAFNLIKREHFVDAVNKLFPALTPWTDWCYGESSLLLYDHRWPIESSCGVQQGDPLGPLYFCCGINCLVNEIQSLDPVYNKWYMDDGGIIGDVELLKKVWKILQERGPELGLNLNPSKCEWSWLDPNCTLPCPIRLDGVNEEGQVKLVPHSEIQMLGVPLGSDSFTADYVESKLLGRLSSTIDRLIEFENTQAASYLLRVSYSIVRAVHFMRTTPLRQWKAQAKKFDKQIRRAIERILGFPMSDTTFTQACLTPKLGGLGLRRTEEHANFAYTASWHEALRTSREGNWDRPDEVAETYSSQSGASYKFDEEVHAKLIEEAPTAREAQRLRRVAQPHANGFITAVPSQEDGKDTILKPLAFRTAIRYRLGVRFLDKETPCPLCMQPIDIYGDHATCCTKSGDLIVRHNALRNLVAKFARDGILSPVLEKKNILGDSAYTGRRPGDVTLPLWSNGKGLALDIAVTSPLSSTGLKMQQPCEQYANNRKHNKYDADFKGSEYDFGAFVWESLRAINSEGENLLRQIMRFASQSL